MSMSVSSLLRNTYVSINKDKLESSNLNLFINGNDLTRYINENNYKISDNDIISIVDTNLNNIYWDNRELLSITNLENLIDYMKQPQIEFNKLDTLDKSNIQMYSVNNDNIDYNVLYITVGNFIKAINNNNPIITKLPKANINIEFQYAPYDFYNHITQKI